MNSWWVAGLFIFLAVVLLGFYLFWVVIFSDYVVYPIDNMGTTSVWIIEIDYINPWFFLFEFPFVVIGAGAAFAIGSHILSKGWKVVGGYSILALTLVGVCLYTTLYLLTYNWIYQLVPQNIIPAYTGYDTHMFIQSAISNGTVLSGYFWTAFCFVVAGVAMGLLGARIARKARALTHAHFWEVLLSKKGDWYGDKVIPFYCKNCSYIELYKVMNEGRGEIALRRGRHGPANRRALLS